MADDPDNFIDDGDDDLFGDDSGGEAAEPSRVRELDDEDLDSGDDIDRHDRDPDREDLEMEESRDVRVLDSELSRHAIPKASDEEISSFRIPRFLGIAARPYVAADFTPPTTDHHSDTKSDSFSAYATATSTIRYRKVPQTGKLESNTLLHRWSDGSVTLQVGDQHYELQHKPLVPPKGQQYSGLMDSHQYLATPQVSSQLMQMIGHLSSQYTVRPNKDIEDDALEKLQSSLAAAARGRKDDTKETVMITANEDPELQKKRAEIAEKERLKAQRRRETASARAENSVRYRSSGFGAGLSIDDLEGSRSLGATRKRPSGAKRPNRSRHDYSSEEEYAKGRGRNDEYDLEDDFVATSDEGTPEPEADDDEEEEILEDSDREERRRHKKQKARHESEDEDAEGELDDDVAPRAAPAEAGVRGRRNIIEDDEDDE